MKALTTSPSLKEYDSIIRNIRKHAKAAGLKRSDIPKAVKKVRGK
jgi:hypothetical protein